MFLKIKLSEIFTKNFLRFFKTSKFTNQTTNLVQFHSGGDDYCPYLEVEGLGGSIGNNPRAGFVLAWRDDVERKSKKGEKRIYSVLLNEETGEAKRDEQTGEMIVAAEIHLKHDGIVVMNNRSDLNITVVGDCNLKAANINAETQIATIKTTTANLSATDKVNIDSPLTNIGTGGAKIARLGDEVEVKVESGSSAGTWKGKIISSGVNTSI